jgi:type VI protein secretion system component VasA
MDKVVVEEIKEGKRERKYKQAKRVVELGIVLDKITIKIVEKHVRAQFTIACTPITIKEVGDKFH